MPSLEFVAGVIEVDELELAADGLEGLGELGVEEFDHGGLAGGAFATDGLGNPEDVFGGLVDANEEGDLDVGAEVVHADEAVLALAVDLDALDGDVHVLGFMDDGEDDNAGEGHLGAAHAVADEGAALLDLAVAGEDTDGTGNEDQNQQDAGDGEQRIEVEEHSQVSRFSGVILRTW
ncbi:MAG: hypothetical protein M5U12_02680 [Verrucomicrobia bacterium]|nr:hypothetical protein [Verrucomicrobiota bacterium]